MHIALGFTVPKCGSRAFSVHAALPLRALTMQDSITESKTLNYILFMVFC